MCNEGDNERYYLGGMETQGQFRYRYKHTPKPADSYTHSYTQSETPWGCLTAAYLLHFSSLCFRCLLEPILILFHPICVWVFVGASQPGLLPVNLFLLSIFVCLKPLCYENYVKSVFVL